jgi:hypothetical protein
VWEIKSYLEQVIEGKIKGGIEVTERRGRRRRMLLDYLNILTPELNPSAQRCLTRFLLGILKGSLGDFFITRTYIHTYIHTNMHIYIDGQRDIDEVHWETPIEISI